MLHAPSRRTITRRLLPEKYKEVKSNLKEKLTKTSTIALTKDTWSSQQGLSYCCLTVHTIKDSWKLESYLLETFNFNTDHSGQNIASELTRVVSECCITDNASNMTSGIQKAGWNHLPCFAHTLNLVVQVAVNTEPVLSKLQEKCKHIIAHFHRSTKSSEKLRSVQQQLNLPQLKS